MGPNEELRTDKLKNKNLKKKKKERSNKFFRKGSEAP